MSFFDDLRMRVEQSTQSVVKDFTSYVQNQIVTPAVKIGEAAKGNISEAQIKAGQTGSVPAISPAQSGFDGFKKYLPLVAIATIVYFVVHRKGKK